jgi:hypothetical protein
MSEVCFKFCSIILMDFLSINSTESWTFKLSRHWGQEWNGNLKTAHSKSGKKTEKWVFNNFGKKLFQNVQYSNVSTTDI